MFITFSSRSLNMIFKLYYFHIFQLITHKNNKNVRTIFPELECLVMKDLPMLVSFYKKSRTLYWPKLNTLRVSSIPKIESISAGILVTALLRSV